jgi:hypothetical protein
MKTKEAKTFPFFSFFPQLFSFLLNAVYMSVTEFIFKPLQLKPLIVKPLMFQAFIPLIFKPLQA